MSNRKVIIMGGAPGLGAVLMRYGFKVLTEADVMVEVPPPRINSPRHNFDTALAEAAKELRAMEDKRQRRKWAKRSGDSRREWLGSLRRAAGGY